MDLNLGIFQLITLRRHEGNDGKSQDTIESTEVTRQSALLSKSGARLRNPESMMRIDERLDVEV